MTYRPIHQLPDDYWYNVFAVRAKIGLYSLIFFRVWQNCPPKQVCQQNEPMNFIYSTIDMCLIIGLLMVIVKEHSPLISEVAAVLGCPISIRCIMSYEIGPSFIPIREVSAKWTTNPLYSPA
jgi:hypothetical protein